MEDVVLHYKPGPDQNLSALIETTEKLLAPFPCRPPQVFTPWFPFIVDRHRPLRPARPAPTIPSAPPTIPSAPPTVPSAPTTIPSAPDPSAEETREKTSPTQDPDQTGPSGSPDQARGSGFSPQTPKGRTLRDRHETTRRRRHSPGPGRGVPFVPETPPDPDPRPESKPESPSKRCWAVFRHRVQTKDQTRVQSSSRRFLQAVSKLQPRQRVKWIIDENNCSDMEQVWRCLSRPVLSSLPSSCNAHMNRDQAQIWVYCDVVQSEQVGLSLKEGLLLKGKISLWERCLGHIYSL